MSCKKWKYIYEALRLVGIVLLIIGINIDSVILIIISVLPIITSIVISIVKWRCPHCKKQLSERLSNEVKKCPWCGNDLE